MGFLQLLTNSRLLKGPFGPLAGPPPCPAGRCATTDFGPGWAHGGSRLGFRASNTYPAATEEKAWCRLGYDVD
eukprot:12841809-Alexandrium_andersonii.AAC.1